LFSIQLEFSRFKLWTYWSSQADPTTWLPPYSQKVIKTF
jgi:hypothetical protein